MELNQMKHFVVCDTIDRVINIDYHGKGLYRIYDAIRRKMGLPLTYSAARGMLDKLAEMKNPEDVVLIGTGFLIDPYHKPETDGMIAAPLLARALDYAFKVTPVIVSEEESMDTLHWACQAAEMTVTMDLDEARGNKNTVCLIPISKDEATAKREADEILAKTDCKLMVSIERPGANEFGVYHSALGGNINHKVAKIDYLFEEVHRRGGFTVGVGDLGNELGVGNAREDMFDLFPFGRTCCCGCGGGTITAVCADAPIMGASSEIAVYGLLAALQELSGKQRILCTADLQLHVLQQAALHGAVDGQDGRRSATIDIMGSDAVCRLIQVLHDVLFYGVFHTDNRPEFLEYMAALPDNENPFDIKA